MAVNLKYVCTRKIGTLQLLLAYPLVISIYYRLKLYGPCFPPCLASLLFFYNQHSDMVPWVWYLSCHRRHWEATLGHYDSLWLTLWVWAFLSGISFHFWPFVFRQGFINGSHMGLFSLHHHWTDTCLDIWHQNFFLNIFFLNLISFYRIYYRTEYVFGSFFVFKLNVSCVAPTRCCFCAIYLKVRGHCIECF